MDINSGSEIDSARDYELLIAIHQLLLRIVQLMDKNGYPMTHAPHVEMNNDDAR